MQGSPSGTAVSSPGGPPRQASGFSNWPQNNMSNRAASSPGGQQGGQSQQERLITSTILREEFLNGMPLQDQVKYVEVPVIEEVIRHVPRKEYVEVEKKVPRYEYEWIERVVEVPQIQYVDRHVEVPQVQEVLRHVPVRQVVDVPKEVIKYVPKIEMKYVEREVEVLGEVIEVPKPYIVENKVMIPKFVDQEVATVVAQRLHPVLTESETDFQDVDVKEFNPYLVPVDVYLPKPVQRQVIGAHKTQHHRVVDIPVAHFNALLKSANVGLCDADLEGRLITVNGIAPVAYGPGTNSLVSPISNEWESQRTPGQIHVIPVNGMSFSTSQTQTSTTYTGPAGSSAGGQLNYSRQTYATPTSGGATTSTMLFHSPSIGGPAYYASSAAASSAASSAAVARQQAANGPMKQWVANEQSVIFEPMTIRV